MGYVLPCLARYVIENTCLIHKILPFLQVSPSNKGNEYVTNKYV